MYRMKTRTQWLKYRARDQHAGWSQLCHQLTEGSSAQVPHLQNESYHEHWSPNVLDLIFVRYFILQQELFLDLLLGNVISASQPFKFQRIQELKILAFSTGINGRGYLSRRWIHLGALRAEGNWCLSTSVIPAAAHQKGNRSCSVSSDSLLYTLEPAVYGSCQSQVWLG